MGELSKAIGVCVADGMLCRAEVLRSGGKLVLQRADECSASEVSRAPTAMSGERGRVVAALPCMDVMTRVWAMPKCDEGRLRDLVTNRLEAESPVSIEQLAWGFRSEKGSNGQPGCSVLVQAARRTRVDEQLAVLAGAQLQPEMVTSEAEAVVALARHAFANAGGGAKLVVLAGARSWVVAQLCDGLCAWVRRIRVDAGQMESAYRQIAQLIGAGGNKESVIRLCWCPAASWAAHGEVLAERLQIPFEAAQLRADFIDGRGAAVTTEQLANAGPAIGLALAALCDDGRLIALMRSQAEQAHAERWAFVLDHPWRWAVVAATLIVAAFALHAMVLRHEMKRMQAGMPQMAAPAPELDAKVRSMQRLERYRIDVASILSELGKSAPEGILLSSVQVSRERRLVIKGTADDPKKIFAWADTLRKLERFSTVTPERTAPGQGGDFTISADLTGVTKLTAVGGRGGAWQ